MPGLVLTPYLTKTKLNRYLGKMKKIYLTPEMETVETKVSTSLLTTSNTGGGISDDYSSSKDDTPSTDPDSDFGW